MTVYAFASDSFSGELVTVEVDIRRGIPCTDLVGLADNAVKEARERIKAAIRNSGFNFPLEKMLISLAPSGVKKAGASFDLAMALAILFVSMQIPDLGFSVMALGELELSGNLRQVSAVLPAVASGIKSGIKCFIVPMQNLEEAQVLAGSCAFSLEKLDGVLELFTKIKAFYSDIKNNDALVNNIALFKNNNFIRLPKKVLSDSKNQSKEICSNYKSFKLQEIDNYEDMADIRGQAFLRRALEVSAAGGHHVLLFGPPGTGKSMASRRLPSICPDLNEEDAVNSTMLHSLAGLLPNFSGLLVRPPFRSPHHSASAEGIIGGGKFHKPGEISLAHGGILLLDEAAEFKANVLQALREPLEEGYISIARADKTIVYPSRFTLVLTCNPCPCGNLGRDNAVCLCSADEIRRYWKKLGGPLLDRIDIRIPVKPEPSSIINSAPSECSASIRKRVIAARQIQNKRYQNENFMQNGRLPPGYINKYCSIEKLGEEYFEQVAKQLSLSSRACHSVIRLSRTIADLDNSELILKKHLEEAFSLRKYGDNDMFWISP